MTHLRPAGLALALALVTFPAAGQTPSPGPQQDVAPPADAPSAAPRILQLPPAEASPPAAAPQAPASEVTPPASQQAAEPDRPRNEPAADPAARFQFVRVGNTVLKLDGETGAVSLCGARDVGWSCQALPENRVALDKEIDRLQQQVDGLSGALAPLKDENGALKQEIVALKTAIGEQNDKTKALKAEMGALKDVVGAMKLAAVPPPPPPPALPAPEGTSIDLRMPTAEDYQRARVVVSDAVSVAWRRLVEMIAQVQTDMMRKG